MVSVDPIGAGAKRPPSATTGSPTQSAGTATRQAISAIRARRPLSANRSRAVAARNAPARTSTAIATA